MNVLAIDTSTEILAVSLCVGAEPLRHVSLFRRAALRHTSRLMYYVQFALNEAEIGVSELDLVACMRGPGSFTGLRIGMATTKGLAQALAARTGASRPPIVSFDTLRAMAYRHRHSDRVVLPVIDGRKGRYYCAAYLRGEEVVQSADVEASAALERLEPFRDSGVLITGCHAEAFLRRVEQAGTKSDVLKRIAIDTEYTGGADALVSLAATVSGPDDYDPVTLGPTYLRASDAQLGASR
ncbi:MAG: tRNA (adenosine(37)-N6)-threonylcarbamoyltransferase complex dimerization subunit type 1 TsaB [Spirochaetales bacterium]